MAQTIDIPNAGPETYCCLCLEKDNLRGVFRAAERTQTSPTENGDKTNAPLQGVGLVGKIYECTNIKLSPSLNVDCAICRRCLQAVDDFYQFRLRSKRVNDLIQVSTKAVVAVTNAVSNGNESPDCKPTAKSLALTCKVETVETVVPFKPHRCRYCPKSFRTLEALTEHGNRAHVSNRRHHCPNCLAQFQHAPSLARHTRNRSCFAFTKYRCRVCSESFPDQRQWADHIRVHAKDFPFQCPDCWSQFKHKATLRRHANTVHLLVQC